MTAGKNWTNDRVGKACNQAVLRVGHDWLAILPAQKGR